MRVDVLGASAGASQTGIGKPVRRKEDLRLITGAGRFSDDLNAAGQLHAVVLRSPHAHAWIRSIDTAAARNAPDVHLVLTGEDAAAAGVKPIAADLQGRPPDPNLENRDGSPIFDSSYPLLARLRVRFVGQAVAMVVAGTVFAAKDAAELIAVDYEVLPAVTATRSAAGADAPVLWDHSASNVCLDAELGDKEATDAAFARAAHVVRLETWIQRVTGVPLETRSGLAIFDPTTGRHTLYAGSGGVVRQKRDIETTLNLRSESVRVVAHDIGGNFGTKNATCPEHILIVWASKLLSRPVKWTCERTEAFLSDFQGRDLAVDAELALDTEGNFLAVRSSNLSNLGAYATTIGPLRKGVAIMSGLYRIPTGYFQARGVLSNTPATFAYRSAGRPEAMFVIERLIDIAADNFGFDPIELRRRNLIRPDELPYRNPSGVTYDNGTYEAVMDSAMRIADWGGFSERRAESRGRGRLRGIGLANYIELTMGAPRERCEVIVRPSGKVDVIIGTLSSGQGHETSFTQCVSEWLGVPFQDVRLIEGDTDLVPVGGGSHSGRSMRFGGVVMGRATEKVIERGGQIARLLLRADNRPVEFARGRFHLADSDTSVGLFDVAKAAEEDADLPSHLKGPLSAEHDETFTAGGYPYGSHVCEVEIDPDTGRTEIVAYAAVDDVGRAINPLILHGQTHGGVAQGVGQAMWEHANYDPESGQMLSASFMDYAMPRADLLPSFATELSEVPSPTNPLGVRAGGEGGTTPALAVVINAIVDALSEFGIIHIEMPATPERVWRAIHHRHKA